MKLRLISLIALLGLLISACAPAATPAPTAPAAPAAQPTTAPAQPTAAVPPPPAGTPEPTPDFEKIVNPQPEDWKYGPDGAAVTFIEWADFQCPYCSEVAPLLKKLADAYPKDVQIVYRHFPLPTHDKSVITVEAAEAAGAQGKFWEMESLLFEKQADWTDQTEADIRATLTKFAEQINLDVKQFNADLDAGKYKGKATSAQALAQQLGLPGTPFLLINQQPWPQDMSYLVYSNLEGMVKFFAELPKKQFKQAPDMTIDKAKSYTATIKTDKGDIQIKLLTDKAPVAVNNFVFLAKAGWYDNVPFHRVLEGFMAQAGDPSGLGFGGPGYVFDNEVTGIKFDKEGLVAMANAGVQDGKGTNGSQFFITFGATPQLDAADPAKEANYTIFGEVSGGMDVVKAITLRDPQRTPEVTPTMIKSVTIEEK
ncbi:MAG: peptidylprolyl isomerase [Thermoflexales bacterium]|nr:peptidylprolyl isomerase [Thermoflexales bacterium]